MTSYDQPKMMEFARDHDWGSDAELEAFGGVSVTDVLTRNGETLVRRVTHYSLQNMRDWAGY